MKNYINYKAISNVHRTRGSEGHGLLKNKKSLHTKKNELIEYIRIKNGTKMMDIIEKKQETLQSNQDED